MSPREPTHTFEALGRVFAVHLEAKKARLLVDEPIHVRFNLELTAGRLRRATWNGGAAPARA